MGATLGPEGASARGRAEASAASSLGAPYRGGQRDSEEPIVSRQLARLGSRQMNAMVAVTESEPNSRGPSELGGCWA